MWWPIAPGCVRAADRWGTSAVYFHATAPLREAGPTGVDDGELGAEGLLVGASTARH